MDFFELAPPSIMGIFAIGLGLVIIGFGVGLFGAKYSDKSGNSFIGTVSLVSMLILTLTGVILPIAHNQINISDSREAHKASIVEQVSNTYGINLSDDEFATLNYPKTRPSGNFEAFGEFSRTQQSGEGFIKNTYTLVWLGDKFAIASSVNGEDFELLPVKE